MQRKRSGFIGWWNNLSIFKRLYGVVGVMALLIAFELFTLRFAMQTLSAVRAFVGGEGLWSKAQKDAVSSLEQYINSGDPQFYVLYLQHLSVPLGDHKARVGMEKPEPDVQAIYEGFIGGRNDPQDIPGVINLFLRFQTNPYLARAIAQWIKADELMQELMREGDHVHKLVSDGREKHLPELKRSVARIDDLNARLTVAEDDFSSALGEGSRWMESTVLLVLLLAVATVESTGLYLTFSFSRHLSRGLKEINQAARAIGQGSLEQTVEVRSNDELGQLAASINKMGEELKNHIGERQHAETASQWKSIFVANMSHEIRTPLSAIMGFTELLKDPETTPEERIRYVDIIRRTGENLNKVINDVLDLSKVEAGKLEIAKSSFELKPFIEELRELMTMKAVEHDIELRFELNRTAPEKIKSDPARLRQILINLIGNAIKFTPEFGSVKAVFQISEQRFRATIIDTGPGIPIDQQSRLFQPFSQASGKIERNYGGTGLGLYLSRRLAKNMSGELRLIHSQPGLGSTFSLIVPIEAAAQSHDDVSSEVASGGLAGSAALPALRTSLDFDSVDTLGLPIRALVVDDSFENQHLVQRILEKRGASVTVADNGKQALEAADGADFDLILMDMQMPVMNGFDATVELRRRGYKGPIIALTAFAMKEDRDRCMSAGCTDYVSKPIKTRELLQLARRWTVKTASVSVLTEIPATGAASKQWAPAPAPGVEN